MRGVVAVSEWGAPQLVGSCFQAFLARLRGLRDEVARAIKREVHVELGDDGEILAFGFWIDVSLLELEVIALVVIFLDEVRQQLGFAVDLSDDDDAGGRLGFELCDAQIGVVAPVADVDDELRLAIIGEIDAVQQGTAIT